MKKHLLSLTMFFVVMFSSFAFAQPTLTDVNCGLLSGDKFTWNVTPTISPGSAGANQVWNFSTMTLSTSTSATIQPPASTPSAGLYPTANISLVDGFISDFCRVNTNSMQEIGNYYNGGSPVNMCVTTYTDPVDYLHFPFNFNNTYTDAFYGSSNNTMVGQTRSGSITVTADGYGTLIIPTGTFVNVMRVHSTMTYTDTVFSTTFFTARSKDEYLWYLPGTHFPVAGVAFFTNPNPKEQDHAYYISQYLTGLNEIDNPLSAVKLFPVPASEVLNITIPNGVSGKLEINIYNSLGQKIKTVNQNNESLSLSLNISDLAKGVYFMRMIDLQDNLSITKSFIVDK